MWVFQLSSDVFLCEQTLEADDIAEAVVYILSTKPHVQVIIYTNQLTNQNKPMWTLKQVKTRTAFKASHVTLVPLALHFHFGKCNHANMEKRRWWCLFSFSLLKLGKQFFLLVINYNSIVQYWIWTMFSVSASAVWQHWREALHIIHCVHEKSNPLHTLS